MRFSHYAQLCALARRIMPENGEAEDIVQEALLAAFLAGRTDFDSGENQRWLVGTVRNRARMSLRGTKRRRDRDRQWHSYPVEAAASEDAPLIAQVIAALPAGLRSVAALALSGHNRCEIAYLLKLNDAALRQRIRALKKRIREAGLTTPEGLPGLTLGLAYGRIRSALRSKLLRQGGVLASHDPDGHLFIIRGSQNNGRRQQVNELTQGEQPDEL